MAGNTFRRAAAVVGFCLLVAAGSPVARSEEPVTESEAYDFVQEWGWVNRSCDADRVQQLILPDATFRFTVEGDDPVTMGRDEFVREFRKDCFHTRQSYDRSSFSVRIDRGRAVMAGRWEHGQLVQFFFLDSQDIDWVEETMIVVRSGEALGLQEMEIVAALKPEPEPTSGTP